MKYRVCVTDLMTGSVHPPVDAGFAGLSKLELERLRPRVADLARHSVFVGPAEWPVS